MTKDFLSNHIDLIIYLLLTAATLAVYWQVRQYDFINLDDNVYIYENQNIKDGITKDNIIWAFTATHASNWHPLTWLSHMLDIQLFGMNSGRHHLVNLLFHITNTLLLFFLFKNMTGSFWKSGFVAALFALHPLHVESVAWISERKDVLSTFFWMLAMLSYFRYARYPAVINYFFVILFFSLGLMSKPMVVTLPFVFLLIDYWPLNRFRSQSMPMMNKKELFFSLVWEKMPLLVPMLISCFLTFHAQNHGGAVVSLVNFPIEVRIANAIVSYVTYIEKMLYPFELALYYPHSGMPPLWKITLTCILLTSISFLALKNSIKHPYIIVGWLWYLGTLVPVIGFVQVGLQSLADRYTYIPSIGLFMIVAYGFPELLTKCRLKKIFIPLLGTIVLIILMAITYRQAGYWQNSMTLFEHALKITTKNQILHFNLGNTLVKQKRLKEAINHYLEAIEINPNYLEAHFNLGITYHNNGNTDEAIKQYLKLKFPKNHHAAMRSSTVTREFITDFCGTGERLLKLSSNAASAISLRTSEKAKWFRP